jgi:Leucine Rich repeat
MYLLFEILFYLGLLTIGIGLIWLLVSMFRRRWLSARWGALILLLGIVLIGTPFVYTRYESVDLGPRLTLVQGEKHITLTGWDQEDYSILKAHPETIVLQIANSNFSDETVQYLQGMANLRELDLNDSQVTDAGLQEISKLTALETLRLRGTRITDAGLLEHLTHMPQLKRLDLRQTSISAEVIEQWKAAAKGRRVFH